MKTQAEQSETIWIGEADLRALDRPQDVYRTRVAVWAGTRDEVRVLFEAHAAAAGYEVIWLEEVLPAAHYLAKHPGEQSRLGALARSVNAMHKVEMDRPTAKAATDPAEDDGESYLVIEEIPDIEPLDMQFGVDEPLTVPAPLQAPLFGQPEPTETEIEAAGGNRADVPPMRTYAILDAAKMPYLLTAALENSGLRYQSLFQGEAQEELQDHAPYLVELRDKNAFTRRLFTGEKGINGLWEKQLGIYIRSRAEFDAMRKHFRKFTRIQDQNGKWYYFRWWLPENKSAILQLQKDTESSFLRLWLACLIVDVFYPSLKAMSHYRVKKRISSYTSPLRLRHADVAVVKSVKADKFLSKVHEVLRNDHPKLWQNTTQAEILALYTQAHKHNFTIERAAYDFIRCHLRARHVGIRHRHLNRWYDNGSFPFQTKIEDRAVSLEVGRVDYERVRLANQVGAFQKLPSKNTFPVPALQTAIKRPVEAIGFECIP